jgi:hypothetical protein
MRYRLPNLYRGGMQFYDGSAKPDTRIDTKIEDIVQRVRGQAYDIASSAIQPIRELSDPHSVDGISVCLDFLERTGADAQAIESERASLAEARERRRIVMGFEPFDAHTYYSGLRAIGADPCVRQYEHGDSLVESVSHLGRTGDSGSLNRWAIYEDPDRRLCQKIYALRMGGPASERFARAMPVRAVGRFERSRLPSRSAQQV